MRNLEPAEAAFAANEIYNLIPSTATVADFGDDLNDLFDIGGGARFKGQSGALLWKDTTGFALVAPGKSPGPFANDLLVTIRGSRKNVKDLALTDGNVGIQRSHAGQLVHAGFNTCFGTFKREVTQQIRGWNPRTVHCVGHSLGGALATLTAEWLHAEGIAEARLYTFGCPRVGNGSFASNLTKAMDAENIHRVSHRADVVPMVPLWPFIHVPEPGTECFVDKGGYVPGVKWHDMKLYIESVKGQSWTGLRRLAPESDWQANVETWLDSDGFVDFSIRSISMVQKAVVYLVKKICHAAGVPLQLLLTAGLTVLDALSMLLHKGLRLAGQLASWVEALLGKIMKALGQRATFSLAEASASFIRWLVSSFASGVYRLATRSIDAVHS